MRRPYPVQRPARRLHLERCAACGQVLAQSDGCPANPYPTATPWGSESYWPEFDLEPAARCPDCWAELLHPHHHDCIRAWCELCEDHIYAHAEPEDHDA